MTINLELKKISDAFIRVKNDINSIKTYMNKVYLKNQNQDNDILKLQRQVEMLTKEIISIKNTTVKKNPNATIINGEEVIVIGNNDSMMAHRSACPYGQKVTKEHRISLDNIEDAVKKGYKLCACLKEK